MPEDLAEILRNADKIRDSQKVEIYDTVRVNKDGREMNLELVLSPIKDSSQAVIGVSTIARDVTERRLAQAAKFHLAAIIESSQDSMVSINLDGIITSWNRAAEQLYGYPAAEAVGKSLTELVLPQNILEVLGNIENVRDSQKVEVFDSVRLHKDDHEIHLEVVMSPIKDEAGQVIGVSTMARDVTEGRRAVETLRRVAELDAFRVKLTDALRPLDDALEIQAETCRILGEHLGVDRAYYVEVNEADGLARVGQDYLRGGSPSLAGNYPLTEYGWSVRFLREGETVIVADTQTADIVPNAERGAMAAIKIIAHISAPLIKAGKLVGALCVTESAPHVWTNPEIELVREVAEHIYSTIERARAERAVQESEAKYRTLFDSMDEGYFLAEIIFDADDNPVDISYLEANPAAVKMTGTELIGKTMRELDPNYEAHWFEIFGRVAKTGIGERHERAAAPLNAVYSFYVFKVGASGERKIAAVYQDVTTRQRAEDTLRESEERLRFVMESVADYVIITIDPNGIITDWNSGAKKIFGYSAIEAVGQSFDIIFTPEDRAAGAPQKEM